MQRISMIEPLEGRQLFAVSVGEMPTAVRNDDRPAIQIRAKFLPFEGALAKPLRRGRAPNGRRQKHPSGNGKRACIYARFSSKFQHSTEDQVRSCREWCEQHQIDVDDTLIFVDRAQTGKKSSRPGLDDIKQAIRAGRVDCAVVFSTSRLHRKTFPALAFGTGEYFEHTTDRTKAIPQTGNYHVARRVIKLTSVRQSSDKLLLVENFNQNIAGNGSGAHVNSAIDAVPNFARPAHPSQKNDFLFVDGHAQSLKFQETYPTTSSPTARPAKGMWARQE